MSLKTELTHFERVDFALKNSTYFYKYDTGKSNKQVGIAKPILDKLCVPIYKQDLEKFWYDSTLKCFKPVPKYVKLNGLVFKLRNNKYYRTACVYEFGYKIINGILYSWLPGATIVWLHYSTLIEATEDEYKKDNDNTF